MAGIVMEDKAFRMAEIGMGVAQGGLGLSPTQVEKFEEFHACELYGGYGVFEGIDQEVRFQTMRNLLHLLEMFDMHVVYGAVNIDRLSHELYASADPLDICFRVCAQGIPEAVEKGRTREIVQLLGDDEASYTAEKITPLLVERILKDVILVIMDETEKKTREALYKTFRSIRPRGATSAFHDDMYFGDSKYSIGIQLADACSYFIGRHLAGDVEIEPFYELVSPYIVHYEIYPPEEQLASVNSEAHTTAE